MIEPSREEIPRAVESLLTAQTWDEKKRLVEAQRHVLLTDAADQVFANLLEQKRGDAEATRLLEEHRELVARCQQDGIELAFASFLLPTELQVLLSESERLTNPHDMPRKVEVCRAALRLVNRNTEPQLWGKLQNLLATSLIKNPDGERADNLEHAIFFYQQALEVCTRQAFPQDWAEIQHTLAVAYYARMLGEHADNLERTIYHFEQALEVRTRQAFPEDWAATQTSLALAYRKRLHGERADNLEQAIFHCEQALEVHARQAFPEDWATLQYSLAIAYYDRIRGERADNLERAIHHFQQTLEEVTPMTIPRLCLKAAYGLGRLLFDLHRFTEARHAFVTSYHALEAIRGEIQREGAKRGLAEKNADLYADLVSCCLQERDEAAAFQYAVAGKGRAFVDQLASIRLDPSTLEADDPELAAALRTDHALHQQIDALRNALIGEEGSSFPDASFPRDVLYTQLAMLQQQAASLWEEMVYKYPALTATQQAPTFSANQACALADELDATLVEYYRHTEGWCAFVVTSQGMKYIPLPLVNDGLLTRMANWVRQVESPSGTGRNPLSYRRLSEWYDAVFAPLRAFLPLHLPVILAPFGQLHVLPLAAALPPQTGRFVAEDYQLVFAPSLAALRTVREQARRTGSHGAAGLHRLLNVAYPGTPGSAHHLPNVLPEAQAIAAYFAQVTPLYQEAATPDAVVAHSRNQDAVHFGCHGSFDANQPEESGLLLAGGRLTVQRIITELRLDQARLATLGACESGRAVLQSGDEYTGLMQAILTTGVQAVVASLWKVDDDAAHALFAAFYARLIAGHSPALALQEAGRLIREQPGWAHPYYWAAFQVSGLAHEPQNPVQVPLSKDRTVYMNASTNATTRGGKLMNVEQQVEGALILLEQMREYPNEVLEELKNETERDAVFTALEALTEQADTTQSDADLLHLTDAIYHLVEDQPGLKALLLPEGADVAEERSQRYVTMADQQATTELNTYAQARAPQIHNAVIECRMQLVTALQKNAESEHRSDQGKKP